MHSFYFGVMNTVIFLHKKEKTMADQLIQVILSIFSLKLLYLFGLWFLLFGFMVHLLLVQIFTQQPIVGVLRTVALLHIRSVVIAFVVTPILAAFMRLIFGGHEYLFEGQFALISYIFVIASLAAHFFCVTFIAQDCRRMRYAITIGNICIGILGYLVLKALDVISWVV